MGVIIGTSLNDLPGHLASIPAGEVVNLAIVTEQPVNQQMLSDITDNLRQAGVKVLGPAAFVNVDWEGYTKAAVYVSFRNPAMPASGEYSFWIAALLALGVVGALGYVVWKGGDVMGDTMASLMKMAFPLALLGTGAYIIVKSMETSRS